MALTRKGDTLKVFGDVIFQAWDESGTIVTITVSQEALEDYASLRGIVGSQTDIFMQAMSDILDVAERIPMTFEDGISKILVQTKDLNG